MTDFYRLYNQIKHYDWGSPHFIPRLLGLPEDGRPYAELWMGGHPGSPSQIELSDGLIDLGDFISRDAHRYLGEKTAERYGALPYLFKLLAAERPLSIQAHPNMEQAREGFERENREGLAQDAPNRNYRDPNHKPEIVCALTPFTGMCGFRSPSEIKRLLTVFLGDTPPAILCEGLAPLMQALETPATDSALRNFFTGLFRFSLAVREALTEFILRRERAKDTVTRPLIQEPEDCEWELMQSFASQYPGDPAIIAPLYLNVFRLQAGEAVFLKAGVLHAYIQGFAVELMANSDNVLRGGLTPKHIDVPELTKVLEFAPLKPKVIKPGPSLSDFTYQVPCEEFSLRVMHGSGGSAPLTLDGPSICIVTEGAASIEDDILPKGESIFVPPYRHGEKPLELRGSYTLYIASIGASIGASAETPK